MFRKTNFVRALDKKIVSWFTELGLEDSLIVARLILISYLVMASLSFVLTGLSINQWWKNIDSQQHLFVNAIICAVFSVSNIYFSIKVFSTGWKVVAGLEKLEILCEKNKFPIPPRPFTRFQRIRDFQKLRLSILPCVLFFQVYYTNDILSLFTLMSMLLTIMSLNFPPWLFKCALAYEITENTYKPLFDGDSKYMPSIGHIILVNKTPFGAKD